MKRVIFLDLEETIIDNWQSMKLNTNVSNIRQLIHNDYDLDIGIFSFAIMDDTYRKYFELVLLPKLEDVLNVTISHSMIPTVDDIIELVSSEICISPVITKRDFFDFYDKRSAFEIYCRNNPALTNVESTLIDDSVIDTQLILNDRLISTININHLRS